jgi:hypothetical protein
MAIAKRRDDRDAIGSDGFDYPADYLDQFGWYGLQHPFAADILAKEKNWETLGFFTWLYGLFPETCLESRKDGGQESRYFPGNMRGDQFRHHLNEIGMPLDDAIAHLRVLESYGILWIVHRGEEVLYLELRPSAAV